MEPYPPIERFAHGLLEVGDENLVYWETSGNPHGNDDDVVTGYARVLESSDTMREAALAATERFKELPAYRPRFRHTR